jgi:phospholipid transport system substrate-binding protein
MLSNFVSRALSRFACCALFLGLMVALPLAAHAQTKDISKEAGPFIQSLGERAIALLADKNVAVERRNVEFRKLFDESFDISAIGRFTLGRYWRGLDEDKRKEFLRLFGDSIVATYSARFSDYTGETFKVSSTRHEGDNHALVGVLIDRPSASPVRVDWRVLKSEQDGKLRIVDLVVEGISLSVTQQQEFTSVIQRGGGQIDPLLTVLRERIASPAAPSKG